MRREIITGIDLGTDSVKIVVSELASDGSMKVLGTGSYSSAGMKNGYIIDVKSVSDSVAKALDNVVKTARVRPERAYLSIGGISLSGIIGRGSSYIKNSEAVISQYDIDSALSDASRRSEKGLINKKVIHEIPICSFVDNELVLGDPVGMKGSKLEYKVMLVNALEKHIDDFINAVEEAGVEVVDVTAGPLASSFASLNLPQRMQGCILLDIGDESTDIVIYENNTPIALKILPVGSKDITNALAVGLQVAPEEAKNIKEGQPVKDKKHQKSAENIIRKSVRQILSSVKEFFKEEQLDTSMFPAGVLIVGGGSKIPYIEEIAKSVMKLPAKKIDIKDAKIANKPEFMIAYGLCIWGAKDISERRVVSLLYNIFEKVTCWLKQLLP